MAAPALVLGIIENVEKAEALVASKDWQYWINLRDKTLANSMEVKEVLPLVEKVLDIAKEGLQNRGQGEEKYLDAMYDRLERQESPAMSSIKEFEADGIDAFVKKHTIKIK